MKAFLKRFWPWKEINELRKRISFLTSELDRERSQHNNTKSENIAIKGELKIHQVKAVEREGHVRKMAQIIAIKGGILAVLFSCFSISAQPLIRNPVTTNTLGNAPTTAYFLGWDGILTKPAWLVPPAGISVAVNTNAVAVTNGQLVTISGVTDTNAVNGLLGAVTNGAINNLSNYVFTLSQNATNQSLKIGGNDTNNDILMATGITNGAINNLSNYVNTISVNATNQGTVVSNGVVAHTVTVAGTANQIASSVGTAQTLASNPSTTLSLPNPLIAPGVVSVNGFTNQALAGASGVVTNDANGKEYTTPLLDPALLNLVNATNNASTKLIDTLNPANYIFDEEFEGHAAADLLIGKYNWGIQPLNGGSVSLNAAVANHPSFFSVTTGTTLQGCQTMMVNGRTNQTSDLLVPPLSSIAGWTNRIIFKTGVNTNDMVAWIGMVNNIVYGLSQPADWMGIEIATTNNQNILYTCRNTGTSTQVSSGVAVQTSTWYDLAIWSEAAGTIKFSINGANVQSISSNVPATAFNFFINVWKSAANNNINLGFDKWSFVMTGLSR